MLDRWGELRRLEAGLKWQGPGCFKAIRMLGRQPMEADDERVLLIDLAYDAISPGEPTSLADLRCETTESGGSASRADQRAGRREPNTPHQGFTEAGRRVPSLLCPPSHPPVSAMAVGVETIAPVGAITTVWGRRVVGANPRNRAMAVRG